MLFTTSWDDGYQLDLRLADLLSAYGLTGTFYVCPKEQHGQPMLTDAEIKGLADRGFEIGAHTLTHPHLTALRDDDVRQELLGSKRWCEERSGNPCVMACYPFGDTDGRVARIAQDVGFIGGRTTEDLEHAHADPFLLPVTLQVMPFPLRRRFTSVKHIIDPLGPLRARRKGLRKLGVPLSACTSWPTLARTLLQKAHAEEWTWFHLWGHSAELERYSLWEQFEGFLKEAAALKVTPVTNAGLLTEHR